MNIISILLSVAFGIISTYLALRYARIKKPFWFCSINYLFYWGIEQIEKLKIEYRGQSVENLSSVLFAFWNGGYGAIKSDDVAEPILFTVKDKFTIYHAEIIEPKSDNNYNHFEIVLSDDRKTIEIKFKYIDKYQGVLIQIYSDIQQFDDYYVNGRIVEGKKFDKRNLSRKPRNIFVPVLLILFSVVVISNFILYSYNMFDLDIFIFILILYPFVILILTAIVKKILSKFSVYYKLPKEFREYFGAITQPRIQKEKSTSDKMPLTDSEKLQ